MQHTLERHAQTYLFEIDILGKTHVLGVNAKNLETTSRVGNTNVDFTIEATEAT